MDAKEIRAENLRKLVTEYGSIAKLSEVVDTAASYISQIFSEKHSATVGDKLARKIEAALQKPHGWMDREHNAPYSPQTTQTAISTAEPLAQSNYKQNVSIEEVIQAVEDAFKRGSLPPDAMQGIISLMKSMNPTPPINTEHNSSKLDKRIAGLRALGEPPEMPPPVRPKKP